MKRLSYLMIAVAMIAAVNACSKTTSGKETEIPATKAESTATHALHKEAEVPAEVPATEPESTITHAHLMVNGSCEMCKKRIESAAEAVAGVAGVEWDGEAQQLHLNFDAAETSLEIISKALANAGYDTELDKASDDVYNALPGCCKYR